MFHSQFLQRTTLGFRFCTVASFFRAAPFYQVRILHVFSASVGAASVLNFHVLVLHIGIKRLQLAQLKEVCRKQGERLQVNITHLSD